MDDLPADIRVSDTDREATAARLRAACAEGRLGLEEFTERLDLAYRARTGEDLAVLASDLPGAGTADARPPRRWFVGIFGGGTTSGRWRTSPSMTVLDIFGGSDIDMRQALVTSPDVTITAIAIFGGCDIVVPEGADVEMTGGAVFGGNDFKVRGTAIHGGPRIRIRAFSLFGGIDVKDRPRASLRERLGVTDPPSP